MCVMYMEQKRNTKTNLQSYAYIYELIHSRTTLHLGYFSNNFHQNLIITNCTEILIYFLDFNRFQYTIHVYMENQTKFVNFQIEFTVKA